MKAFIYCTKAKIRYRVGHQIFYSDELYKLPNGNIKYGSSVELMLYDNYNSNNFLNGKVVASFELDEVDLLEYYHFINQGEYGYKLPVGKDYDICKKSCLTFDELFSYLGMNNNGYAYHIKNLEIIEPLELSEFGLSRAPQDFCYAYYKGERVLLISIRPEWVCKILNGEKTIEVRKRVPREVER